jgi:hypothetical protein
MVAVCLTGVAVQLEILMQSVNVVLIIGAFLFVPFGTGGVLCLW